MSHQHNIGTPLGVRELATIILGLQKGGSGDGNMTVLTVDEGGALRINGSVGQLDNTTSVLLVRDQVIREQNEEIKDLLGQILLRLQEMN